MTTAPRISVLDAVSDPGNPAKANEDRLGHNDACAFVIDGATGLGDRQYVDPDGSDAAWIAARFADAFQRGITRDTTIPDIARVASEDALRSFTGSHPDVPRYAWPLSAFAMVHATRDAFTFYGLGDSCVFLLQEDGSASLHTAIPGAYAREQEHARSHIARTGGIWTLGLVPEAADHLVHEPLPVKTRAHTIICSDGLADLVVLYALYDAASLVRTALDRGLRPMIDELRRLEREVDPHGLRYPRFKQSDDTTAILVELTT